MSQLFLATVLAVSPQLANGETEFSRPVKAVATPDAVYVANATTGTVTVLDASASRVLGVTKIADRLADLAIVSPTVLAATDPSANELIFVSTNDPLAPAVTQRVPLAGATRIAVAPSAEVCAVTGTWGKLVSVVDIKTGEVQRTVDLPFEPLMVVSLDDDQFFVADAFGGMSAVIAGDGSVRSTKPLLAHNIRGLLVVGDEILISHQRLSQIARTEFADVHWGTLMQNVFTRLPVADLGSQKIHPSTIAIGDLDNGSAEPGAMARLNDGRLAVVIRGTDELLISQMPDQRGRFQFAKGQRLETGTRPVSVAATSDGAKLVVANQLADSLSVIDVPTGSDTPAKAATLLTAKAKPLTAIDKGERAFVSGKLSHDGWLSCNSCHIDGHTPGLRADTLGDDSFGAPKVIPSLLGVGDTAPWGWSGNFQSLENQIAKSIRTTMHGPADDESSADIAAYLRTLKPRPVSPAEVDAGRRVFTTNGCSKCHEPDRFTSNKVVDVGFDDEAGQRKFNPPSLRGLRHRRAFFHDGRAKTIDDALQLHLSGLGKKLPKPEREMLKHYLNTL